MNLLWSLRRKAGSSSARQLGYRGPSGQIGRRCPRNARAEGIFSDRATDRGGYHFNHCGHRDPQPTAGADFGERVLGRGFAKNFEYGPDLV